MKHLLTTLFLLIAAAVVTIVYFRNINSPGNHAVEVMHYIPDDASLVAEFSNDDIFYDAFSGTQLLASVAGPQKTTEFETARKELLQNGTLKEHFENQHIYVSVHPSQTDQVDFLITTSVNKEFEENGLFKNSSVKAQPIQINGKTAYQLSLTGITRPFYVAQQKQIISASFSKDLIAKSLSYDHKKAHESAFTQVSEQQHNNALAILYINYQQLQPLFQQLFINTNPDLFRPFRMLPAKAALSLNYKTDALMFNGVSEIDRKAPVSYLNLFASQQPVISNLRDIFPSTTAYSVDFAVSDPLKFTKDLAAWHAKGDAQHNKDKLFKQVKDETGIYIQHEFNAYLDKEFAVVTTRFQEKLALIEVTNGQLLFPALMNISNMVSDNIGQFKYSKIPFYLLGDAFGVFNKPYFTIINNYLVLANSPGELRSYIESYNDQKFLSKTEAYNNFTNLLSERSNVAFYLNFKNARSILRRDLKPVFYSSFDNDEPGFKSFYGASYQLISSDHNYYTNFCMQLAKTDSIKTSNGTATAAGSKP